jgi:hypothetical protein
MMYKYFSANFIATTSPCISVTAVYPLKSAIITRHPFHNKSLKQRNPYWLLTNHPYNQTALNQRLSSNLSA